MATNNTDFTLPRSAYATFDALTLKQLIKDRLTAGGVFTDQNFEGSNLSALIDVIAFSYHISLFQLNQTASEVMFSDAELYENMNRIVKLIGYKPTGFKTCLLSFSAQAAASVSVGIYTIKRFSYFDVSGIRYTFLKDVVFAKNTTDVEDLVDLSVSEILYQGTIVEHPVIRGVGEDFETVSLVVKDNITNIPINIEDGGFGVFITSASTGNTIEYTEINSIFSAQPTSYVYEKRLNENGFYEFKFGDGVYGNKISAGDSIYIYYLKCEGDAGVVSANQLNNNILNIYSTPQFDTITSGLYDNISLLDGQTAAKLLFTNSSGSSKSSIAETATQIRSNAPKMFQIQNRLVTSQDIETYIKKYYSNIVADIKAVNNKSYIDNVMKYYYSLGLDKPNSDSRVLFNEVNFSTSGQANNVYIFLAPKLLSVDKNNNLYFLSQSQKADILSNVVDIKAINTEIIPQDPVYNAVTVGIQFPEDLPTADDHLNTFLVIQRNVNTRVSTQKISELVNNIFINYFSSSVATLGQFIDLTTIQNQIFQIPGVVGIKTRKVFDGRVYEVPSINVLSYNYVYSDVDIVSTSNNIQLPYFKYPFLLDGDLSSRIIVETVNA